MNIKSAELLQDSLKNLGDSFYRNRAMEQDKTDAATANSVNQAFREAQMAHYNEMENRQQTAADKEQQQNAITQKQNLLKTIMGLNSTGQLSDDARNKVNQWLSTDPTFSVTGMQLAKPANPTSDAQHKQSALVQAVDTIQQYRDAADKSDDPETAKQFNHLADLMEANLPAAVKSTTAPKPNETDTETDDTGKVVKTTNKIFTMPGQNKNDDTPVASTSVPDTRPWYSRLWNVVDPGQVPVPQKTNVPSANLTPQDLNPVIRSAPLIPSMGDMPLNANGVPTGKAPMKFNSALDVKAAFQAGQIDRSTAKQILQTQFGQQ